MVKNVPLAMFFRLTYRAQNYSKPAGISSENVTFEKEILWAESSIALDIRKINRESDEFKDN